MPDIQSRLLLLTEPLHLEWVEENLPPLRPAEVLVRTSAEAISIGAELPQYCGTARSSETPYYPRMTGYESVGTIIACGSDVKHLHIGDRVVAFYGHRMYGAVPETKAMSIPDDVSDALALLAILTCDVAKRIQKVGLGEDEQILITGAGAIGLLTVFMLGAHGACTVDVVEPRGERRELALLMGARTVLSPQDMVVKSGLYTVAFECSSRNAAFELLQNNMRKEGRICVLADGNVEPLVLTPAFHERELKVVGSSDGLDYQEHARWFFSVVREHPHSLDQLFDYQITTDDMISTFENLAKRRIAPVKVLVRYC